ncbi:MAG: peptidylprolyl isomerase [Limisphaerales bacterium]
MMQMKKAVGAALLALALVMGSNGLAAEKAKETALADGMYAEIDTSKGKILLQLEFEKTPMTVANFVGLAEGTKHYNKGGGAPTKQDKPYYDGLKFHRVIADFMVQGGCPLGTGSGGPGYNFHDETVKSLTHKGPGILSMANSDRQKDAWSNSGKSNGSQFFITHKATPWLDGKHTVFGHVVTGQDIVDKIAKDDLIKTVKIIRKGAQAEAFKGGEDHFKLIQLEKEFGAKANKTTSGMTYFVLQQGEGDKPAKGNTVKVTYTGKLQNGRVFDSSKNWGKPLEFPVGVGRVIKGWDETVLDMKKGEKRVIILPPGLAYGDVGVKGHIPPGATLTFELELVDF